ncbi:HET-domain-containing protein [Aulographum hederae CBS 113979]|uniref:HET-domain-containing protein n=1 Tax=Aulographum hederae CBS 113979 TaxID=1176131 RepID=A0A6G1GUJ1_9PEZI|nr:HET-domain-containing protein [Aulographum hederae CBS 113979]
MGGFVLESEGLERFPVDARMIEMLIKADVLAHPEIDIREIQDKSKRDSFARLFAGSQVLWVVVQCIARRVQELPVTPLEFLTAEFVLLSMFTYLFEWCKPDGVCVPIVLRAYGRLDDDLVNQLRSKFNQSYNKEFTTVNDIKRIPFGPAFRTFFVSQEKATNSWQSWAVYMLVCCGTGAFNGIRTAVRHQLMPPVAWTVWRISILISVVVPFVGCVFAERTMRLIDAKAFIQDDTFELVFIPDVSERRPKYAILSHRWIAGEEVTFDDAKSYQESCTKGGFYKIRKSCEQALAADLEYVWVDTCCINKNDNIELQIAINSMYAWYKEAAVCYVYLSDVDINPSSVCSVPFEESKWFSRGWTLQELIAPSSLMFFDTTWTLLGTQLELASIIEYASGISIDVLNRTKGVEQCSVAERMFWASSRETTLVEDEAYSLLGIFNVHMPMLYGEGMNAFIRLQEEILKTSNDHTIFAWTGVDEGHPGLLASSPSAFSSSGHMRCRTNPSQISFRKPGIEMALSSRVVAGYTYLAILDCVDESTSRSIAIFLRHMPGKDVFVRIKQNERDLLYLDDKEYYPSQKRNLPLVKTERDLDLPSDLIQMLVQPLVGFRVNGALSDMSFVPKPGTGAQWDPDEGTLTVALDTERSEGMIGALQIKEPGQQINLLRLGFDNDFNPICMLATNSGISSRSSFKNVFIRIGLRLGLPLTLFSGVPFAIFIVTRLPMPQYAPLFLLGPFLPMSLFLLFLHFMARRDGSFLYHNGKGIWGYTANESHDTWDDISDPDSDLRYPTHAANDIGRRGLWLLKGSRLAGLDVQVCKPFVKGGSGVFGAPAMGTIARIPSALVDIRQSLPFVRVVVKRGKMGGRAVWDVDITTVGGLRALEDIPLDE